jgi:hypothetical protein
MARRKRTTNRYKAKTILRLPDLEQSKNAALNSLAAASSQESYVHAIDEFIGWYCSEPRLAFNRSVVLRYRFFLEQKNLAPSPANPFHGYYFLTVSDDADIEDGAGTLQAGEDGCTLPVGQKVKMGIPVSSLNAYHGAEVSRYGSQTRTHTARPPRKIRNH